ncbi:D-alanyl-D-alanine carboxypeptidase family protein [Thiococcus pfennigii]|uniref:D-alanyl-D-alanine carboxypeptidase family protein n=1 Tax=Thiococcus pfennigii TaxID=1057 RepID=UPI001905BD41|nr:D-alanyl-D-alanine carboxypeptidase family protein [Thiococcus pfennigii]MBK1733304.1 serine-type D-Ala-D-Ala carboxypeptidase [Thiococcus pfennigii]
MKAPFLVLLILIAGVAGIPLAGAQTAIPAPPAIGATSYLLMDHDTGAVLVESNADERVEPASLTKIMTAYAVFREIAAGKLSAADEVLISEKAWRTEGSRTFLDVGSRVSVDDLLMGMIVQSGNDASVALAEHIAGSEAAFAGLMNAHAQRLGAVNSRFTNATGLPDPELYTTARDIALIASAVIREFPEEYGRYKVKEFVYNDIRQSNRNRLLFRDESVDGMKTGYTAAAGYCLVASAQRDGMRLISVVMGTSGAEQRARDSLALLNYGFRFYESHRLYEGGAPVQRLRIWQGRQAEVPIGPSQDVHVTIPRGRYPQLGAALDPVLGREAPVASGERLGTIIVSLDGQEVLRVPAVALEEVPRGNLWRRLVDSVLRMVQS